MRIIGGSARGRRLHTPSKSIAKSVQQSIRPTPDRAREALFNIIGDEIRGSVVLDLYAGTGALGLEALSRNAKQAVFVDSSLQAIRLIEKNINLCGFSDRVHVFKRDLPKGLCFLEKQLPGIKFDFIFADPPYRKNLSGLMLHELGKTGLLSDSGLVIIEDDSQAEIGPDAQRLALIDHRRYGDTGFWLYRQIDKAIS